MKITVQPNNYLIWNNKCVKCALGINGIKHNKREGDGATPAGVFPLKRVLYREDRLAPPETKLPIRAIKPFDGWSDDPQDPEYNKLIMLPYEYNHETLWREDNAYDIIVELGHNDDPPIPRYGSAVFIHLAHLDYNPTKGCIALNLDDLLLLLKECNKMTIVKILDESSYKKQ